MKKNYILLPLVAALMSAQAVKADGYEYKLVSVKSKDATE